MLTIFTVLNIPSTQMLRMVLWLSGYYNKPTYPYAPIIFSVYTLHQHHRALLFARNFKWVALSTLDFACFVLKLVFSFFFHFYLPNIICLPFYFSSIFLFFIYMSIYHLFIYLSVNHLSSLYHLFLRQGLIMQPWLAWNYLFSYLCSPSDGITDVPPYATAAPIFHSVFCYTDN